MKILSCGAGMQSTALALMSCENKREIETGNPAPYPLVPIYDAVYFCDLGSEPCWVYEQVEFIKNACINHNIPFTILKTGLHQDYLNNFGKSRVVSIPFWSVDEDGKKGKMMRTCTLDYKINAIIKDVKYNLLGYKKYQRLKEEDKKAHEMHIGFSKEEERRCKENPNPLFVNSFPLCEMKLERKDNYKYILEKWGLNTKASACNFCPFHTNYFFGKIKTLSPKDYEEILRFDDMLEREQPNTKIRSKLYISKSRKRIRDLKCEDCQDREVFPYNNKLIWNGF